MTMFKRLLVAVLSATLALPLTQALAFIVSNIRIEGLSYISRDTVLNYVPVKAGQEFNPSDASTVLQALYATGFFSDVNLGRQGNTLVIQVVERATIGAIHITGNKLIKTDKLMEALKSLGIALGNPYDSSSLTEIQKGLEQQYYSVGRYTATVTTNVVPETRNRVSVNINIYEGKVAKVKQIQIIGNRAFSEKRLLKNFNLSTWKLWSFITHGNDYAKEKLDSDLAALQSFYFDRGYLRFKVDSYTAALTPDKKYVYITVHIIEGPVYHVKGFALDGNLLGKDNQARALITLNQGEVFSRQKILAINRNIQHLYADQGYAFTQVIVQPQIDDQAHTVFLGFTVKPGQRIYVRRINFSGNTATADYVLRREMRQMENGVYSLSNIEESKRRLNNLGYLQNIKVQTVAVAGEPNQVDLDYQVSEMSSATAKIQAGYSDLYGLLYGASVNEDNLFGTGRHVGLSFDHSNYASIYNFNYSNPYYTDSGISRSINVFVQHYTPGNVGITSYSYNASGASVNYGWPVNEFSGINFGYGYQHINLNTGAFPPIQIQNFTNAHGKRFDQFNLATGWQRTTYDRALLPTSGTKQALGIELGVPILNDSLDYYLVSYQAGWYYPLIKQFIFHLDGQVAYGNGYAKFDNGTAPPNSNLPFFKNYFAGGIDSVNAYQGNTLGPKDSNGNPIGGSVLTIASASLIFPNPISQNLRTALFFDAGNVYDNQFNGNQLRYSVGVSAQWWIPSVGPLEFSFGEPLNPHSGDRLERFQFSVGTSF
ncbi:MAG: outer membrane protein assembly factor BamA [Gammaproteobacteria bacterium]